MEAVHRVTAPEVSEIIDKQLSHIELPTQEDMDAWISGRIKWSDIPEIKQAMGQMSSMLHQTIATQAEFAAETAKLGSAALTTQSQLNYYSAQIEAHTKKLNYIISRQLEARIREYIAERNIRIFVSVVRRGIE